MNNFISAEAFCSQIFPAGGQTVSGKKCLMHKKMNRLSELPYDDQRPEEVL